jgi:hypothetical protein
MSNKRKRSLKDDVEYGNKAEIEVIRRGYFGEDILKNKFRFSTYDARSEESNTNYEIKARRCDKNNYPTTIIPYSKILKKKKNEKLIFVFQFTDGLYFIEYNQKLFDTFAMEGITYYREGIEPKSVKHVCIPVDLLMEMKCGNGESK